MRLFRILFLISLVIVTASAPMQALTPKGKIFPAGVKSNLGGMPRFFPLMENICEEFGSVRAAWCREDVSHIRRLRNETVAMLIHLEHFPAGSKVAQELTSPFTSKYDGLQGAIRHWATRYYDKLPSR